MTPRELLGIAQVPGGAELRLFRRGGDFMIVLDRNELMNSRMSGSEEALATLACDRLHDRPDPHFLVGGYGMGFTTRAALARLGPRATSTVAEIAPEIMHWARGPMADLTAGCLDDPRLRIRYADVAELIRSGRQAFDAILLDVDNGPDGLTRQGNDVLYSHDGLMAARTALTPGGVLAIWSARPDPAFTRRLARAGFRVEETVVKARGNGKGPRHVIWVATKP